MVRVALEDRLGWKDRHGVCASPGSRSAWQVWDRRVTHTWVSVRFLLPGPAWRKRVRGPRDPSVEGSAETALRGCGVKSPGMWLRSDKMREGKCWQTGPEDQERMGQDGEQQGSDGAEAWWVDCRSEATNISTLFPVNPQDRDHPAPL